MKPVRVTKDKSAADVMNEAEVELVTAIQDAVAEFNEKTGALLTQIVPAYNMDGDYAGASTAFVTSVESLEKENREGW